MSSEIKNRVIELCKKYKRENVPSFYSLVQDDILKEYGVLYTPESIRSISRHYRFQNNLDNNFDKIENKEVIGKETIEFNKDGTETSDKVIRVPSGKPITTELLLSKHGFDPNKFTLVSAKNTIWQGNTKGRGVVDYYSQKIVVQPNSTYNWTEESVKKIFDNIKPSNLAKPMKQKDKTNYEKNGDALLIPIVDLHYALEVSNSTTGNVYNKTIARECFFKSVNEALERTKDKSFEKIYFTIGCDILNYDNLQKTTTKGTPQDGAAQIEDAIIEVTNMLITAIEELRKKSDVHVIHIPGNHDKITGFGIANAIRCYYDKCDDVAVDYRPIDRKYFKFGNILIGMAHDIDVKKINDIIQADARNLLGSTDKTIYFLSHYHHEETMDKYGTDIRRLSSVVVPSRWTYEKGLTATRKTSCYIINKEYGITDVLYIIMD